MIFYSFNIILIIIICKSIQNEYIKLPGAPNDLKLKSGYLNANQNGTWRMFYMLLESRDLPRHQAPLLIWFNGGPGCSSLTAFFEEFGPVWINFDGRSVFENPDSWYHRANILFLESPIGVGFSYDTQIANYSKADDSGTAEQNFWAVSNFFGKHPEYSKNEFFVATESYGGVYGPMISALILEAIADRKFANENFKGLIIGNGFMNVKYTTNTMVLWSAYHARTSPDEWEAIKEKCKTPGAKDVDEYDFTRFMSTTNNMDYRENNETECGRLLKPLIGDVNATNEGYDFYNYHHDCYVNFSAPGAVNPLKETLTLLPKRGIGALMNKYSTDNKLGFMCWADDALTRYLNSEVVKKVLKIDKKWSERRERWKPCNDPMYNNYTMTFPDTTQFFTRIFNSVKGPSFRILIYNGDIDTACNYLADQYFMRDIARKHGFRKTHPHQPWYFSPLHILAGFFQRYEHITTPLGSRLSIDVLSIKGSGHFVPLDRPGPSLQMLNNFLIGCWNYTNSKYP